MYLDYLKRKVTKEYCYRYCYIYVSLLRKTKASYYCNLFAQNKHNVKVIWQHIHSVKGDENNVPKYNNVDELNNFYADLGPNTVYNVIRTGDYGNNVAHNVHTFVLKETNIDEVLNICGYLISKLLAGINSMSTKLL